jgi:2-amino-4-hydroxy-6-hydroxymethyldihydropteridine diphosphokinase
MKVYIGLGSNLEDREGNLNEAIKRIGETAGELGMTSSVYETEPWGFQADEQFLNMAVEINTSLNPVKLMEYLLKIESRMGRVRSEEQYSSRLIDIDILLYGDVIVHDMDLVIPHPRMHERKFVLVPLNEIAPLAVHPVLKKTVRELLQVCSDTGNSQATCGVSWQIFI